MIIITERKILQKISGNTLLELRCHNSQFTSRKGDDVMPTTYTHYAYGQEVFHKLPEELQRKIEPYIEYYNIGVTWSGYSVLLSFLLQK